MMKISIVCIRLNKRKRIDVIEIHRKQGKKLIFDCNGVANVHEKLELKYGKVVLKDYNKESYAPGGIPDTKDPINDDMKSLFSEENSIPPLDQQKPNDLEA